MESGQNLEIVTDQVDGSLDGWIEVLQDFEFYCRFNRRLSTTTATQITRIIRTFFLFLRSSGILTFKKINLDLVRQWKKIRNADCGAGRVYQDTYALRTFINYAAEYEHIENFSHLIPYPRLPLKLPKAISVKKMNFILNSMETRSFCEIRNRTMAELLYASGMRRSELANLASCWINYENRSARIIGKGGIEREIIFGKSAQHWMEKYKAVVIKKFGYHPSDKFFVSVNGTPLSPTSITSIFYSLAERLGLTGMFSTHVFRHSAATHLLLGGMDIRLIQEFLGHSSVESTVIYLKLDTRDLQRVHKMHHPRG